jgi:hypothetical protein
MHRQTVTITTRDFPEERHFHLSPDKAKRFAAKIRAAGGTARIGPFQPSAELVANLARAMGTK